MCIVQARLYRAVRRGEVPNHCAIDDIYRFLLGDNPELSKKHLGVIVNRTVLYDPKKLKGVCRDNDKARVMYSFHDMKELEYGLEWMICTWLRKFLNDQAAPGETLLSGPEMMTQELDMLADSSEEDFFEFYEEPLWDFVMPEPDWKALTNGFKSEVDEVMERSSPKKEPLKSIL